MLLDGEATTVAGILPAGFRFQRSADVYVPLDPFADRQFMRERANHNGTDAIGRLKPGVTFEAARAEMTAISRRLQQEYPKEDAGIGIHLVPLREQMAGGARTNLFLLLGAVGMVLLIACVNVANMLLARSFGRAREMAIRTALGATRGALIRQLLAESLVLAAAGGLVGALAGTWGYDFVSRLVPWEMRALMDGAGGSDRQRPAVHRQPHAGDGRRLRTRARLAALARQPQRRAEKRQAGRCARCSAASGSPTDSWWCRSRWR